MTDTTQPPAETLAEAMHCALKDAAAIATAEADRLAKEMPMGSRSEGTARAIAADITRLAVAALTRRAGGDAIPAGWQLVPVQPAAEMTKAGEAARDRQGPSYVEDIWSAMLAATPKPPAGGDAGAERPTAETYARLLAAKQIDSVAPDCDPVQRARMIDADFVGWMKEGEYLAAALALPAPVVEGE